MKTLNTRTARRIGYRDGGRIAEEVVERVKRQAEAKGVITREMEEEAFALMTGKVTRAVKDVQAGGATQLVAEQYYIAVIGQCVARLRTYQASFAIQDAARIH